MTPTEAVTHLSLVHFHAHVCSACPLFAFSPISLWGRIARPVKGLFQKGKSVVGGLFKSVGNRAKKAAEDTAEQKVSPEEDAVLFPVSSGASPFLFVVNVINAPTSLNKLSTFLPSPPSPLPPSPLPPSPQKRPKLYAVLVTVLGVGKLLQKRASLCRRDGQSCCELPSAE